MKTQISTRIKESIIKLIDYSKNILWSFILFYFLYHFGPSLERMLIEIILLFSLFPFTDF